MEEAGSDAAAAVVVWEGTIELVVVADMMASKQMLASHHGVCLGRIIDPMRSERRIIQN